MFRYNDNGKLISSMLPIEGLTLVTLTEQELNHCIGFDPNGQPLYDTVAIQREIDAEKEERITIINREFDNECKNIGVEFAGTFNILNSEETIVNPRFQYDDESQNRLLKFKDIEECGFWRSVNTDKTKDNKNVVMSNAQKNNLYNLLLLTWGNKFAAKSAQIDLI